MIGDDIAAALPELRSEAESLLVDTCIIERAAGAALDATTHQTVTTWATVWSGPCRARVRAEGQSAVVAAELVSVLRVEVSLAVSTPAPLVGQRITIITATNDPSLAGVKVFVVGAPVGSQTVLRRVMTEKAQEADR